MLRLNSVFSDMTWFPLLFLQKNQTQEDSRSKENLSALEKLRGILFSYFCFFLICSYNKGVNTAVLKGRQAGISKLRLIILLLNYEHMNGWEMPSIMSKCGATIGLIFPCVGVLLVNLTCILLLYSNNDLHPTISLQVCSQGH